MINRNNLSCQLANKNRTEIIDIEGLYKIDGNQCGDILCKYLHAFYWSTLVSIWPTLFLFLHLNFAQIQPNFHPSLAQTFPFFLFLLLLARPFGQAFVQPTTLSRHFSPAPQLFPQFVAHREP